MTRILGILIFVTIGLAAQEEDALLQYRQGRYNEAIRICLRELEERGIDQATRRMDSYSVLGWSYLQLGAYEKALTSARQARNEIRYDIRIIEIEAEAMYFLGRLTEALALFEEYVSLSTNTQAARIDSVYYFMGEIFLRFEEYHHADIAMTTALYHNPLVAPWWARLGYAKEQLLDTEGARTAYTKALELQPSLENARTGMERLGGLAL